MQEHFTCVCPVSNTWLESKRGELKLKGGGGGGGGRERRLEGRRKGEERG